MVYHSKFQQEINDPSIKDSTGRTMIHLWQPVTEKQAVWKPLEDYLKEGSYFYNFFLESLFRPIRPNLLQILRLTPEPSPEEVKETIREVYLLYHPDKNQQANEEQILLYTEVSKMLSEMEKLKKVILATPRSSKSSNVQTPIQRFYWAMAAATLGIPLAIAGLTLVCVALEVYALGVAVVSLYQHFLLAIHQMAQWLFGIGNLPNAGTQSGLVYQTSSNGRPVSVVPPTISNALTSYNSFFGRYQENTSTSSNCQSPECVLSLSCS